jgi:hypothetical protein
MRRHYRWLRIGLAPRAAERGGQYSRLWDRMGSSSAGRGGSGPSPGQRVFELCLPSEAHGSDFTGAPKLVAAQSD